MGEGRGGERSRGEEREEAKGREGSREEGSRREKRGGNGRGGGERNLEKSWERLGGDSLQMRLDVCLIADHKRESVYSLLRVTLIK